MTYGPRAPGSKSRPKDGHPQISTFPFSDGYPWDEELIRAGVRAVSTHGIWLPEPRHEEPVSTP